jgi:hypothetical protein
MWAFSQSAVVLFTHTHTHTHTHAHTHTHTHTHLSILSGEYSQYRLVLAMGDRVKTMVNIDTVPDAVKALPFIIYIIMYPTL